MKKLFGSALVVAAFLLGTSIASATQRAHVSGTSTSHASGAHSSPSHSSVAPRSGGWHGGSWRGNSWHGGWHGGFRGGHLGWGWGWRGWGWGWGWAGYPGYGYYGPGYGTYVGYAPGEWAAVKTDVAPEEARVFLDGRYIGTADDFDGYPDFLYLKPGNYRLEFRLDGFQSETVELDARPGVKIKIDNKLKKVAGAKHYGSYDTPQPEGGVRRYWGKDKEHLTAMDVQPGGGYGEYGDRSDPNASAPEPDDDDSAQAAPPPGRRADDPPPPGRYANDPAPEERRSMPPASAPGSRARIVFRVEPGDAAVYVDDRFAGTGEELSSLSRGLQVPPGMHKIVVSRPGFASESTQVDASAGEPETVEITLERR